MNEASDISQHIISGSVCIDHFASTDLIGIKKKVLRYTAIPSIFPSSSSAEDIANYPHEEIECTELTEPNETESDPHEEIEYTEFTEPNESENDLNMGPVCHTECCECKQKEEIINELKNEMSSMQAKMNNLRQVTNKWRQKSYHLERMRSKLNDAVIHMRNENIINSKLVRILEVSKFNRCNGNILYTIAIRNPCDSV